MTDSPAPFWHKPLVRALERRFGKSTMPYAFKLVGNVPAYGDVWRVTDAETGSFVQAAYSAGRLMVRRTHDGVALGVMAPAVEVAHAGDGDFVVRMVRDPHRALPRWIKTGSMMTASEAARLNHEYGADTVRDIRESDLDVCSTKAAA